MTEENKSEKKKEGKVWIAETVTAEGPKRPKPKDSDDSK